MANRLGMAKIHSILTLHERGWSNRRIARTLGIHRETVGRHVQQATEAKPAQAPAGSDGSDRADIDGSCEVGQAKPAKAPPGSDEEISRTRSACEPLRSIIEQMLAQGLSAQRIYQDLVVEHGFTAKYHSVRRFVQKLRTVRPLPFRRMECAAGAEAQVDFGTGAPVRAPEGKRRRTHVFRIVLSHSRKGYSESVFRQTTDGLIQCLENAFWHFGGVPRTVVVDNLKAAVTQADWYDPELNPKLEVFCAHYGTVLLPTKPYMPRHKGKVEGGVKYVQSNALKGRCFANLAEQNRHLRQWEARTADTRIHGTTKQQVAALFVAAERPALLPLPAMRFPVFQEAQRRVHRDGHVEVAKAYYSAPPEYVSRQVWVRWDGRLVRLFNQRMEQIAVHAQVEPGRFGTQRQHIAAEKISGVERGTTWLLKHAGRIGGHANRWARAMLEYRGLPGARVLVGLLALASRHSAEAIDRACQTALGHQAFRLQAIRRLLKRDGDQQGQFEFLADHEIIRDMADYSQCVRASFDRTPITSEPFAIGVNYDREPTDGFTKAASERPGGVAGRAAAGSGGPPTEPRRVPGSDPAG